MSRNSPPRGEPSTPGPAPAPVRPRTGGPIGVLAGLEGLRALRHHNYRLFWAGQAISLIGTQMQRVAQAWLILTLSNDPAMLGLAATAQYGPVLLFGLFGGIAADSLPRRRTLIATQAIMMTLAFLLALLAGSGTARVWQVLGIAFLLGCTTVVYQPTRQAFLKEMVGRDDVVNAIALNSATVNVTKIVGPAVAGLAIAAFGVSTAFFLNGLSFIAVIAGLLAMRPRDLHTAAPVAFPRTVPAVVANLAEGLGYIRGTPQVRLTLAVIGIVSTAAINFTVVIPPLARDVLDAGPSGYGFLMAAAGVGSVTSAIVLAFRGRPGMGLIGAGAITLGVFEAALALSDWMPLSLACMFVVGLGSVAMSMTANSLIQIAVPDALRGRVMAVYLTVWAGTTPIGGLIFGGIASVYGVQVSILIGGLIAAATGLIGLLVGRRWGLISGPRRTPASRPGSGTASIRKTTPGIDATDLPG